MYKRSCKEGNVVKNLSYDIINPKIENKKEVNEINNQKVNVKMIGEVIIVYLCENNDC